MTQMTDTEHEALKKQLQKRFKKNQRQIEALYHEMANCLMAEISLEILEKLPTAKTLVVSHLTEEYNEYNSVQIDSILDESGKNLLDESDDILRWAEDLPYNYSADYLILLPETINLEGQLRVLEDS